MQLIAIIAVVFAVAQWGSRDVRFGTALLLVALIAFLAGRRERRQGRAQRMRVVVDFLDAWRFCPLSTAAAPGGGLEDSARQLLDALDES
jgi:triphosphoribosyl-dephospho-CoA synthetase